MGEWNEPLELKFNFVLVKYAIVDIETTGGSAKSHCITEIAIIRLQDGKELDRYQTLIKPDHAIPQNIVQLTGISNEMVNTAPTFFDVADKIYDLLTDVVFVAHNVGFDYGFVKRHLSDAGYKWSSKRLCTVRLSRKLMPGLYSYSLGKLAQQLGYKIDDRHRALGDCQFTSTLFQLLLEKDLDNHITFALNARSTEATLPPNLPRSVVDDLPTSLGVYLFFDAKGKVIYVGKAKNLKHRVREHFRGNSHTGYKSRFAEQIVDVKWIKSPNELVSLLTEAKEIKRHWPPFNRMMKRVSLNWGIFRYDDQNGYGRLSVGRVGKWAKPVVSFKSQLEARQAMMKLRNQYTLCARFCDLQDMAGQCAEEVHGLCRKACLGLETAADYNKRVDDALNSLTIKGSMVIQESGFREGEQSVVLIENGRYKGHGIAPSTLKIDSVDSVKEYIETAYDDQDMQSIIQGHINRHPDVRVIIFD